MHEVSLAISIIDCLNELIKEQRIRTIEKVTLQIGELSNVMPEALSFAFEAIIQSESATLSEGLDYYPLENCQIIIQRLPAKAICRQCQAVSHITHESKICLYCKGNNLEIISGYELQISEVEGEEEHARGTD